MITFTMKPILRKIALMFLLGGLMAHQTAVAQDNYQLHIKKAVGTIKVDGQLAEKDWASAQACTRFWQFFPSDTAEAKSQTVVYLTYDDQYLYFGARCYNLDSNRAYVTPSLRRDFRGEANDAITFTIDPFCDNTNAFQFGLNPFGVQREGLIFNGGNGSGSLDQAWDNRWYSAAQQYPGYWIAEMAIPFKTLRFNDGATKWNIKFYRIDSEQAERSSWPKVPQQYPIISLAFAAELIWDEPLQRRGANAVLIPYALADYSADNRTGSSTSGTGLGGDAKIGVGPALNLDLTFNPDFSQVEVDQQVTNLDRFEIFFPERRQFFLENADLFGDFGTNNLRPFFSRRIGVARDESTGQNIQNPIYAGARLSGKLDNNWRIGLLGMQTARDLDAQVPSVNFAVAALQRKVFSRSNIGLIAINKQPLMDAALSDTTGTLFDYNRVLGLDYNLASKDNKWTGKFFHHRSFDPALKGKNGVSSATLSYNTLRWDVFVTSQTVGANYRPEVGFARRQDYNRIAGESNLKFYPKKGPIQSHGPGIDVDFLGNPTYGLTDWDANLLYSIQFRNLSIFGARLRRQYIFLFAPFDPTNTGGLELPDQQGYTNNLLILDYFSDFRKKLSVELSTRLGGYFNGSRTNLEGSLSYRFQPLGQLSLDFTYNRIRLPEPYNDANLLLIGPRFDLTFSKSLFWTTFIQYNNQIDNLNINSRLQWRFRPVSDLFLVYTDNYFPETLTNKNRAVVLKCTYWLNL